MQSGDVKKYLNCLEKFKKYFKIQDDSKKKINKKIIKNNNNLEHNFLFENYITGSISDNSTDSNSENGLENNSNIDNDNNTCKNS